MKLEAEYISKENKLYTIEEKEVSLANAIFVDGKCVLDSAKMQSEAKKIIDSESKIALCNIDWKDVEPETDAYSESFLASLRDFLKLLEESNAHCVIVPSSKDLSKEKCEAFTSAMKHAARRIKDCKSVIGFAIPFALASDAEDVKFYVDELSLKHSQYVYFATNEILDAIKKTEYEKNTSIVVY